MLPDHVCDHGDEAQEGIFSAVVSGFDLGPVIKPAKYHLSSFAGLYRCCSKNAALARFRPRKMQMRIPARPSIFELIRVISVGESILHVVTYH
jgi:hypothetical protein